MIPISLSSNLLLDLLGKIFILSGLSLFILLLIRSVKLGSADARAKIYLILLVLPFCLFISYLVLLDKLSLASCGILSLCQASFVLPAGWFGSSIEISLLGIGAVLLVSLFVMIVIKQALSFVSGRRLLKKLEKAEGEPQKQAHQIFREIAERVGIEAIKLEICQLDQPLALTTGIIHPRILISSWLVEKLDRDELEAVMAHEIAHVKRRDNFINTLAMVVKDFLFFLPSSYLAWRDYLREREKACDDYTIKITERPLALASALTKVGKCQSENGLLERMVNPVVPSLNRSPSVVQERIKRLLASHSGSIRSVKLRNLFFSIFTGLLILGMVIIPALSWQKPAQAESTGYCCSSGASKTCTGSSCSY